MNKLITLCFIFLLSACSNYLAEGEELESNESSEQENTIPVKFQVRSSPHEAVMYPVQVYIFDRSGKAVRHNEITSSTQALDVKLPMGEYVLSSFSGLDAKHYHVPEHPTLNSKIETEPGKACPTPLLYGRVSFNLQEQTEVSIPLSYIVSSLDFKFQEIPEDARSVEIGIAPTSKSYTMGGSYSNDNYTCKVSCRHVGNEWIAGPVYILPSTKSQTTLTLYVDRPSGKESLSYTYSSTLEAAQPYCFCGKYNDGISLKGTFQIEGWKPGINVDFDFSEIGQETLPDGNDNGNTPDGGNQDNGNNPWEDNQSNNDHSPIDPNSSTLYCNELPKAGDFYQDFYIWKSEIVSSNEARAIVLSKMQWFNILAVNGPGLIAEYEGLGFTGWRVFTKEEAKEFNTEFTETLPALNGKLRQHNQDEFYFYNKERYLCDDCHSAFNVNGTTSIRAVGQKQTYYMRGLKEITFKLN